MAKEIVVEEIIEVSPAVAEVNSLVEKGLVALEEFRKLDQEQVDYIVAKASVAALDQHGVLAEAAVNETGRGVFEDKATKNLFACEHVVNSMRDLKTCGVINKDDEAGIVEIADPVGVVCGLVPTTNPTSTAIFKSLICLKTRNPIIFSFHPSAISCSIQAAKVVYDAAVAAGAPKDCIQWVVKPSMEGTNALMNHDGISTILATGGNAMVRAAYSCGKPALGVGAGNVPAYVEKTANIKQAAHDIIMSKAFDNGMICASEQAVIIDKEVYVEMCEEMKQYHAYFANAKEKTMLEKYMFSETGALNANVVGKPAAWIAEQAGFKVPARTNIICVECKEVGPKEILTKEKLSPVLAVLKANSTKEGLDLSEAMLEFGGLGHSAAIHTSNEELSIEFGKQMKAIRVIWNSPSTFGGIGDVYNSFLPSLTLGCGSYGRNSVSNNVGAVNLINIKRVGRRKNNMQWFKIPPKIYFERDSISYLKQMPDVNRVFIVTDRSMVDLGYLDKVTKQLGLRENNVQYQLFCDVEPDPDITTVEKGAAAMRSFAPDVIIALGGGSSMDAAKGMWLFYEHPEVVFDDLKQKFMDIRKRAFPYPELGNKARLVCIPTTSGTGSEVTPFAVISDKANNKKYPLADYVLTPNVAIIDPSFTMTLPASITADTGMDVLTHAVEALVATLASDYTDSFASRAIKMVFEYLPRAVKDGKNDALAREKMHNASAMAGMAFANAFLGMNHSMAHKVGAVHHVPHGRANAILLPHVIRYNGQKPNKTATWPKYNYFRADALYAECAQMLGYKFKTVEEGVECFAKAVEDLAREIGINMNFEAQGIDEKAWNESIHYIAMNAFEDQCSPANPRLPLVKDMEEILVKAYKGNK